MFWFPKDPDVRCLWKTACKIDKPVTDSMNVCEKHFKEGDIQKTRKHTSKK